METTNEPSKLNKSVLPKKIESFDDILPHIGEAGRYQWLLFLLLLPYSFVYTFLYFTQFFLTLTPEEYWCTVPELSGWNLTDHEKIALSIPQTSSDELTTGGATSFSRCQMYNVNYTEILNSGIKKADPSWPIKSCQNGWSFNFTDIPYASISAELEWVCDKTYLSSVAQSAFFLGSIIGGFIFGYIADRNGRVPALMACNAVGFLASAATTFCNNFWSFCICRLFAGAAFDNCSNIMLIVVLEYVGPKYRTVMTNMSFGIYFAISSSLLPWMAYWIADWRILSFATAVPLGIACAACYLVPESTRWYITNGNIDKAIEMLKKFARINGKTVDPEVYDEFRNSCNAVIKNGTPHSNYTVLDLFKKPRLARITVVLVTCWLLIILIFDGHVWNVKLLDRRVFISFSLTALSELPAAILLTLLLDKWGRRWMSCLSMLICSVFSFITLITPDGALTVTMAVVARLGVNMAANIGFQYTAEMMPTVVRAQGVSLIHIMGYFSHIIGPYIVLLAQVAPELPLLVLGLLSMIVALLTLCLPETMDQDLPETLQEGNDFGRWQSFWWFPCISRSSKNNAAHRNKLGATNSGFNSESICRIDSTKL